MTHTTRPNPTQSAGVTKPTSGGDDTQPVQANQQKTTLRKLGPWLLAIPLFFLVVNGIAMLAGYNAGLKIRQASSESKVSQTIDQQFDLGVEDFMAGRYELARQRFMYVLELDPSNSDAEELIGRAMEALNQPTPTPIPRITATPTETPDLGSYEGILNSAQAAFNRDDWDTTLNLLLMLRDQDPNYRLQEVNALMASALRDRGMSKLLRGELEQGIYDLNLAERFSPLDNQAVSWRNSAAFYTFANSYFGLDWALAVEYFGQICVAKIWGACFKYSEAAREYAILLLEQKEYCMASYYFSESLAFSSNQRIEPTATKVVFACLTATVTPPTATPTETGSPTPTFDFWTPTATGTSPPFSSPTSSPTTGATPTPTNTPGGAPSNTPTATATIAATATPTPSPTSPPPPSPTSTPTPE